MSKVIFDFSDKHFAVFGASSGIGRQIALDLAKSGASVLAVARNMERLNKLQQAYPDNITAISFDVVNAQPDEWNDIFSSAVEKHGKFDGGIDTIGITAVTPLKQFVPDIANDIINTNFWGYMNFIHYIVKKKYSNEGASFVLLSSDMTYNGSKGMLFYCSAKSAIRGAVKVIAREIFSRKQRINSISPGWIDTEMTQNYLVSVGLTKEDMLSKGTITGKPSDISKVALFLLSDLSVWVTGQDIIVDGGASVS